MTAVDWQIARLEQGALVFRSPDGMSRALRDGFFLLRCPDRLDLSAGDRFARSFYLPTPAEQEPADPYRGFTGWTSDRLAEHEGYYRRDVDQTEQFFLERRFWAGVYPPALVRQASAMQGLALEVLAAVLAHLDLPQHLWDEATGRCLSGRGMYHLTFNHFRPDVRARGLNIHKDSGWVTVLRSIEPGLEVERSGQWCPLAPLPDHFIVNFGCAMEILTRDTATPVAAVAHRVVEQVRRHPAEPDRFSYALFADSTLDESVCQGLFRYVPGGGLTLAMNFKEFLDRILHNTYQPDTVGTYQQ
jgi:isopenicillin N synthase-like dioxygenase